MTPEEFVAGCEPEALGGDWGGPLWRFYNPQADLSLDVYAVDEAAARQAALEAVAPRLEAAAP